MFRGNLEPIKTPVSKGLRIKYSVLNFDLIKSSKHVKNSISLNYEVKFFFSTNAIKKNYYYFVLLCR